MLILEVIFWIAIFTIAYTYVGYGLLLLFIVKIKKLFNPKSRSVNKAFPAVTFIVAAYNEEQWMEEKVKNCLSFDYPREKIFFWFVTDGSNDSTPAIIEQFVVTHGAQIRHFHQPERKGKIAAVDRIMPLVITPITIYSDANTLVNKEAIRNIVQHYTDPSIGAVAGEKRISMGESGDAAGAGEGIYWKYESKLKKWEAGSHSVIGAAGELFSIRSSLYEPVKKDTLIEDFMMTVIIAMKGYRVAYAPDAFAVEGQSASIEEELKRKVRIAAGGLQAAWRLRSLLNPFKYGVLSFQYFSHRFLRWTIAPASLPLIFFINIVLAVWGGWIYKVLLALQFVFYCFALLGWIMERRHLKTKIFFVPYYFCVMNYSMYLGFIRLLTGKQSVIWEKAKRADEIHL